MKQRLGMSLLEMMIVVAIAGILTSMSVMGFSSLIRHIKSASAARDISGTLSEARMDAVTRNRRTGVAIDLTARKILMFIDFNNDGVFTTGSGDPVLRNWQALDSSGTLIAPLATSNTNGGSIVHVVFELDGSTSAQLRIVSKASPTDSTRIVLVPVTGLIRLIRN